MPDPTDSVAPPFFHESSGTVRFWVPIDSGLMGASVGVATLHRRYRPTASDDDPVETLRANLADIEAAVRRRVAQGSIEPVMLREYDLRAAGGQDAG
jgi:hypothetical protein